MHLSPARLTRLSGWSLALAAVGCPTALSQVTFSIDNHGPLIGVPDAFAGFPITEGDLLTPATGLPFAPGFPALGAPIPPGILISAGFGPPAPGLGLPTHAGCAGHLGGMPCPIELDALSFGLEVPLPNGPLPPGTFWFSVDEYAFGMPAPAPPNVASEGSFGPGFEASADVFTDLGIPLPPPLPPFAIPPANTAMIDGDGAAGATGFLYPGLGLVEPHPPGFPPDFGDNLDAVDVDTLAISYPIYYSLDGPFIDPLNGVPLQGSAAVLGLSGADVLMTVAPGGGPVVFAPAAMLGLDIIGGPMSDDLDALALWENGTGAFEPAPAPYAWLGAAAPPTDMLLFSVRRGSAVIGAPDSLFGIPIEEGDILSTPIVVGGLSPFPSIFIAAENLALATLRSGAPAGYADELDALDVPANGFPDCNMNGVPDAMDIGSGTSFDCNGNSIPDECDIASGVSADCNGNGVPDECEPDCNSNGVPDDCDIATGTSADCNSNGVPDECDIASGASADCNGNGVPDECEPDCNSNGVPDDCDIATGTSADCNGNGLPDECEQIGVNYCGPAVVNSSGLPAVISAAGVAVPGTPLVLQARQLPANQFGYFLTSMNMGFFMPPGSQGNICLGANIGRYNTMVMNSGTSGAFCVLISTLSMPTNPPQPVLAGQAWNFQCWFRDQNPGVTSNFTDATTVQY